VPEGQVKWHCSSCQKSFLAPAGTEPEACPEGHERMVEDELAPVGSLAAEKDEHNGQ